MKQLAEDAGLKIEWLLPRGGLYATAVATVYTTLGYTVSRRPISDLLYWILWPFAEIVLWLESFGDSWKVMSLGWQMLVRKS